MKRNEIKSNQMKSNQIKSNQMKLCEIKSKNRNEMKWLIFFMIITSIKIINTSSVLLFVIWYGNGIFYHRDTILT